MAKMIISEMLHFILAFKMQVKSDFSGETILTETHPFINVRYVKKSIVLFLEYIC